VSNFFTGFSLEIMNRSLHYTRWQPAALAPADAVSRLMQGGDSAELNGILLRHKVLGETAPPL